MKAISTIAICWLCGTMLFAQTLTPEQVLERTATTLQQAKTLYAETSLGTVRMKGEKFFWDMRDMKSWFDGKTQWTYNASANEVTITTPTQEELQSLNPYTYLTMYKQGFSRSMSTENSYYRIELTATNPTAEITAMAFNISKQSHLPLSISFTTSDGETTDIRIRQSIIDMPIPDSFFTFKKSFCPTAEIIDLR
jgi:outer membrane lipoprotein-sorting protein